MFEFSILGPRAYNRLMGAFARWRALRWDEKRLALGSALAIGAAVAGLRIAGVGRALRAASPVPRPRAWTRGDIRDRVNAVDRAGRYVPGSTCLATSLALAWMLRRRGVAAAVRVGVRTDDGFEAHAWVEYEGVPVTDASRTEGRYAALDGL